MSLPPKRLPPLTAGVVTARWDVWLLLEVGDAGMCNLRVCVRKEHGVGGSSCSGVRLQLDGEAEGDGLEVVPGQSVTVFH